MATRKAISGAEEPPVGEILQTSVLSLISQLLKFNDTSEEVRVMKLEAVWILTNLAFGEREEVEPILDPQYEIMNSISRIISSNDKPMVEQALWFLGNLSGESADLREAVIEQSSLLDTFRYLISQSHITKTLLRTVCWVNSNIARHKGLTFE